MRPRLVLVPKRKTRRRWLLASAIYFPQVVALGGSVPRPINPTGRMDPESLDRFNAAMGRRR